MPDIYLADVSEFQENVDADAYIRSGHGVIICRAHNGYRADKKVPERIAYLRSKPFIALGFYQYLATDRDPRQQAHEFMGIVGSLRENEFAVLDHEHGNGSQTSRAEAWFHVVDPWAGCLASLYSGRVFLRDQLGGTGHWDPRPLWIADYIDYTAARRHEPEGCDWWQYTDRARFAGMSGAVDGSIFHGNAVQFLERVRPASTIPTPPEGTVALAVATMKDGRFEVFVEKEKTGEVFHAWQSKEGGWAGSKPGKNAEWYSLGVPGK